jgi:hypothetical protein
MLASPSAVVFADPLRIGLAGSETWPQFCIDWYKTAYVDDHLLKILYTCVMSLLVLVSAAHKGLAELARHLVHGNMRRPAHLLSPLMRLEAGKQLLNTSL